MESTSPQPIRDCKDVHVWEKGMELAKQVPPILPKGKPLEPRITNPEPRCSMTSVTPFVCC